MRQIEIASWPLLKYKHDLCAQNELKTSIEMFYMSTEHMSEMRN